jgi:chloramphenicol O-acetyltransferase type A
LLNAGKAIIREGKLVMPIAMTIHHGFIDGHHLSLFYKKVEEFLK